MPRLTAVIPQVRATTSTTIDRNPIAPHGASSGWGVASVVVLLVILAAVAAIVWLFFSYSRHLAGHRKAAEGGRDIDHPS